MSTTMGFIGSLDTTAGDKRKTAEEMDEMRQKTLAYEYLCHLEEAKVWLEACLRETLPSTIDLEQNLRNGVYLAKLGHFMSPDVLPLNKIYDLDQKRYEIFGLQFRHTDNINQWLKLLKTTKLPPTFHPETTDIYDKKNMPRLIYCLHALSTHLFKLGKAPLIEDLYGKAKFTDEEIDIMSRELQRYGIKMPVFQKIGGILSSNIEGDAAALHAAIININNALDTDDSVESSLLNPAAQLKYVLPHLVTTYHTVLQHAKKLKIQNTLSRSMNDSYTPDVYDELLTQAEIQGYVLNLNTSCAVNEIVKAIESNDDQKLFDEINYPWLQLENLVKGNSNFYLNLLSKINIDHTKILNFANCNKLLQSIVNEGNSRAQAYDFIQESVHNVNVSLDNDDCEKLYNALINLGKYSQIKVEKFSIPLFHEELKLNKLENGNVLSFDDILNSSRVLSSTSRISKVLDSGNHLTLWEALNDAQLELIGLRFNACQDYQQALKMVRKAKQQAGFPCTLLTLPDIQDCIDEVNSQDAIAQDLISDLQNINDAVINNDKDKLITSMKSKKFEHIEPLVEKEVDLYLHLFKKCLIKKNNSELWLDDIESVMSEAVQEINDVTQACSLLLQVNFSLSNIDSYKFLYALQEIGYKLPDDKQNRSVIFDIFYNHYKKVKSLRTNSPWIVHHTKSNKTVYINIETQSFVWKTPKDFALDSQYISFKDIESLLKNVDSRKSQIKEQEITNKIIKLQAHIRGYLIRQKYERILYFTKCVKSIVKIQSWWKSVLARREYKQLLDLYLSQKRAMKVPPEDPQTRYKRMEKSIIKIQALWRGKRTRLAFNSLCHMKNPPFKVVKYFVPLLDFSTEDYEKEMMLQSLRSEAVQVIRKNQELSKQLDSMDIKIGLLVQNRITLQDVLAHRMKINDLTKENNASILSIEATKQIDNKSSKTFLSTSVRGLKALTKDSRKLLDGYQKLFYLLQTNPTYLSKLLFCLPQSRTNQFLQNVILTLYNFGANARDEYLLLKLFRCSLEEEINCKFNKPMDLITGNPIVLKMAVNHARHMTGLASLRNIVGPLIEKMLNDKNISIETSPVDIYKAWRNQMETRTGQISDLPYVVSQDEALSYEEVRIKLSKGLETLTSMVTIFLERIIECCNMLPFSITYMARVLHHSLVKKFPLAPEKEILKVIGHFVYYQFINAAIVAPDAFDIISLSHDKALSNDQRRNLASVAKILHFSASKKGFGEESAHLQCLNPFIIDCHEKMKELFRKCCQGPSLEDHFCRNEYSEATLLNKPHIYISVQEICDTHTLLVEYEDIIASDKTDKIHTILEGLGPTEPGDVIPIAIIAPLNTEICLTLTDNTDLPVNDLTDINKLFIKTKELCVSVLPFLQGEHLLEALCIGTTKTQQEQYNAYVKQRLYSGMIKPHDNMTLREHIAQLRKYLDKLEEEGYVTREDGYQSIVTSIALDLCNKGKYRRGQMRALQMMKKTKKELDDKAKFYHDQVNYYNQYINKCLENLNAGKRSVHVNHKGSKKLEKKMKSKMSLKYTALKLYEKGILLEIDGLSTSQFKSVMFEIIPSDQNGLFSIKGKFMGVEVDKIELDIQYLLQMQYDGCTIMNLFGKAKINVNLLLFLLNSKFYGKQ